MQAVAEIACRLRERLGAGLVPALSEAAAYADLGAALWAAGCAELH